MSFNVSIDTNNEDKKKIISKLPNFCKLDDRFTLWITSGHEWVDFCNGVSTEIDKNNFCVEAKVKLSTFKPFIKFYEVMMRDKDMQRFWKKWEVNGDQGEVFFDDKFLGWWYDEEDINDLEKYNVIENPKIAEAIRMADLKEYREHKQKLMEMRYDFEDLTDEATSDFDYCLREIVDDLLSSAEHVGVLLRLSIIIKVATELFGEDYKVEFCAG